MATTTRLVKQSPLTVKALAPIAVATTATSATLEGGPARARALVEKAIADGGPAKTLAKVLDKLATTPAMYVQVEEDGVRREYINGLPKMTDTESAQWEYDQAEGLGQAATVAADTEKERTVEENTEYQPTAEELAEAKVADEGDVAAPDDLAVEREAEIDRHLDQAEAEHPQRERAEAKVPAQRKPRKAPAKKAEPKRAPLREGYTTPVGLAKLINERGLYTGEREDGLTSQSMYVYIKSNGEGSAHPFPIETIDGRVCVNIEAGVAWWVAKEQRVAEKAKQAEANRKAKADRAAEREAAKVKKAVEAK